MISRPSPRSASPKTSSSIGAAERLFRRIAEELRSRRVPVAHPLVDVHDHHRCGTDCDKRLQVLALPLDLGEEPCVLDPDADVGRDRGEQANISFSEPTFLLDALDADHADRLLSDEDRDAEVGEGRRSDHRVPVALLLPVEQERLARIEDPRREAFAELQGGGCRPVARLVVVGELDPPRALVVQRHIGDVGVERLAHLFADQLDQRAEIELRSECLPDAVDGRQLGHALPGLVHEPSVVERHRQAAGERRQQALIRLGEGVCPVRVLKRDHAGRATAHDERDEERRADRIAAQHVGLP